MAKENMDLYHIAVKVFLRDGNNLLLIHDIHGDWDLPGGRMIKDEFQAPIEQIIERKITEEIGPDVKYKLGDQKALFRVERIDERPKPHKVRIFGVGFEAKYVDGDISLGEYINEYKWVDINKFKPEDYFTDGWLDGMQEYMRKIKLN